jgi:hypothetical protein
MAVGNPVAPMSRVGGDGGPPLGVATASQVRPRGRASAARTRDRIRATLRCGPLQPTEQELLLAALRLFSVGSKWSEILQELLAAHGSTRVLIILRSLLPATSPAGLERFELMPNGELKLQLEVADLGAVGRWMRQLEQLRTPFRVTISADARPGTIRASWDLGLDQPAIALLGGLSQDPEHRRILLSLMEGARGV